MMSISKWLDASGGAGQSKFINHILKEGEEFVGIFEEARETMGRFGKTIHYVLLGEDGKQGIFDSKNPKIAEFFEQVGLEVRVQVRKVSKDGRTQYEVKLAKQAEKKELGWG